MSYLNKISAPEDLKSLNLNELTALAEEIRAGILKRDSLIGGHVGPNLGFVEATLALHIVFDSPKDKIVFDVSHQCYAHKMVTGRQNGFLNPKDYQKISGYTNPKESPHDFFAVGHTSTSISLAAGLAKARDLKGETNNVIAVIGDGSLSGGEALEGLDFAASELKANFIVVVNDNQMSIAENHGGLYNNLKLLRDTDGRAELNFFKALGYDYLYVKDGNDITALINAFTKVKDTKKPVVVHLNTKKGKGYAPAEQNKEPWHWSIPFDLETGSKNLPAATENYNELTYDFFINKIKQNAPLAVITAGTPGVFGFTPERRRALGAHYIDVGIAEEHAVAMASALAKGGAKPFFCVMSSFIQRTYDQLMQDLALNQNPAVILVYASGISPADMTHLGCFDLSMTINIPNIINLSPATKEEYLAMLEWASTQNLAPVIIRVPQQLVSGEPVIADYSAFSSYKTVTKGKDVAIIALGQALTLGKEAAAALNGHGIAPTLISARTASPLDTRTLSSLKHSHHLVITLEDNVLDGGFGEKIARYYGASGILTINRGASKEFTDREPLNSILTRCRLTPELIAKDALSALNQQGEC